MTKYHHDISALTFGLINDYVGASGRLAVFSRFRNGPGLGAIDRNIRCTHMSQYLAKVHLV
jgi:hypothetical protein